MRVVFIPIISLSRGDECCPLGGTRRSLLKPLTPLTPLTPLSGFDENMDAFRRYYFRPRILHDVTTGDLSTTFMGIESTLPIFISPAAMAKLGHPAGEVNLTKGAGECGIVQGVSGVRSNCGHHRCSEAGDFC